MWVDPTARGLGLGPLLVEAVADWARERGVTQRKASVTKGNAAAALYRDMGFVPTGEQRPLASDSSLTEVALTHDL